MKKEPKSIMPSSNIYKLERTGDNLARHEIYYGRNRQKSIEWGCVIYIEHEKHNGSTNSIHNDIKGWHWLKEECQKAFEELYGHEKFMEVFGRNYL